jgi:hypothetical protein
MFERLARQRAAMRASSQGNLFGRFAPAAFDRPGAGTAPFRSVSAYTHVGMTSAN